MLEQDRSGDMGKNTGFQSGLKTNKRRKISKHNFLTLEAKKSDSCSEESDWIYTVHVMSQNIHVGKMIKFQGYYGLNISTAKLYFNKSSSLHLF